MRYFFGAEPDMGAAVAAQMYAAMNTNLRINGNEDGTGPQFLLHNTGGNQLQVISTLFDRPASIPDMPADSEFNQTPYIVYNALIIILSIVKEDLH